MRMQEINYKEELRNQKMYNSQKDKKIINLEKKLSRIEITVQNAYQITNCEKTKNVLRKLIK